MLCCVGGQVPYLTTSPSVACPVRRKQISLTYGTLPSPPKDGKWRFSGPPPPSPLHPSVRTSLDIFASHRLRPPHSECLVGSKYSQAGPKAKRYLINLPLHQRYHFDGYFQEASSTCDKYPAVPCWALTHTFLHRSDEIFKQTKRGFRPASLLSFGSELDRYLAKARRTASRNEAFDACLSDCRGISLA